MNIILMSYLYVFFATFVACMVQEAIVSCVEPDMSYENVKPSTVPKAAGIFSQTLGISVEITLLTFSLFWVFFAACWPVSFLIITLKAFE